MSHTPEGGRDVEHTREPPSSAWLRLKSSSCRCCRLPENYERPIAHGVGSGPWTGEGYADQNRHVVEDFDRGTAAYRNVEAGMSRGSVSTRATSRRVCSISALPFGGMLSCDHRAAA